MVESSDFSPWREEFILQKNEKIVKNITLTKTIPLIQTQLEKPLTSDEKQLRTDDARALFGDEFSVIDKDSRGRLWLVQKEKSLTSFGIWQENRFVKFIDFPYDFSEIFLDFYNDVLILKTQSQAILLTIDTKNILETTLPSGTFSVFFAENSWHAITPEKTFFYKNGEWQENVRFSHFMDLDDAWRA